MAKLKTWHEHNSSGGIDGYSNYLGNTDIKDMLVFLGQNRDSDILTKSNFQVAIDRLGGESDTVQIHRFGHWACGWFESILIDPANIEAVKQAEIMLDSLSDYPVLDDNHYYKLEYDTANEYWQSCSQSEKARLCKDYKMDGRLSRCNNVPSDMIASLSQ
jgi:hypothetical protein